MNRARLSAVVGIVATLAVAATIVSTVAAGTEPSTARPTQVDPGPRLHLIDQTFAVNPDGTITLSYELTGLDGDPLELIPTTTTEPPVATVPEDPFGTDAPIAEPPPLPELTALIVNYTPLEDPDDVRGIIGSDVDPSRFAEVGSAIDGVTIDLRPLATRADDGTVSFTLRVGTDATPSVAERLELDRPGVYPLRVQVVLGDPVLDDPIATAGTVVQRLVGPTDPAAAPPIDVAIVAATDQPRPDAGREGSATARDQLVAASELAAAIEAPLTVQAAPPVVGALGDADPDALAAFTDDRFISTPVIPFDVSAAAAAGLDDEYAQFLAAGEDVLRDATPALTPARDVWIARDPLSSQGAQLLHDVGTRLVIMDPDVYRASVAAAPARTDLFATTALADGDSLRLAVIDPIGRDLTSTAADRILADTTPVEWAVATLARMLVDQTASDAADATSSAMPIPVTERARVLATPTFDAPDQRLVAALESIAATTPAVRFTDAATLAEVTDVVQVDGDDLVVELRAAAGVSLEARLARLESAGVVMASAASMLPTADPRPDEWTTTLTSLLSTAYDDDDVDESIAALAADAERLRDAVALPNPFTFTMTGRQGSIEVRIANSIDETLIVRLALASAKVSFPEGDRVVTLDPSGETSVIVPVQARSNGTSTIELSLMTPAGEPLDGPVTLTARVTALAGLGQVITVGLLLVVASWWYSSWRTRRRRALGADADDNGGAGSHDDSDRSDGPVESEPL